MGLMPWHYDLEAWQRRAWFGAVGTAGAGEYITVIPPQTDEFWDSTKGGIQADGDDIRVRRAYVTVAASVDFSNDAPNTSTRTIGNFLIELSNSTVDIVLPYAIYWNNASAANAEASVTVTTATTYRWPTGAPVAGRIIACRSEAEGTATSLLQPIVKKRGEAMDVWWDITDALGEGPPMAGRATTRYVLDYVTFEAAGSGVYDVTGVTRDSSSTETAETGFLEYEGRFYVVMRLTDDSGHVSGTDYILKLIGAFVVFAADAAATTVALEFEYRALLQVRDPAG